MRTLCGNITEMLRRRRARQLMSKLQELESDPPDPVYPLTGEFGDVNFFPNWKGENPVQDLSHNIPSERGHGKRWRRRRSWRRRLGCGRNKKRLIYVTIGTGIGTGFIFDGHFIAESIYSHPEIGHHLVDPSGPACVCGFRGCWESLAAGPAMTAWMKEHAPSDYPHGR